MGEAGKIIFDVRKGKRIFESNLIELPIVHTPPHLTILLRDREETETPRRGGGFDHSLTLPKVQLFLEVFLHDRVYRSSFATNRGNIGRVDLVLH